MSLEVLLVDVKGLLAYNTPVKYSDEDYIALATRVAMRMAKTKENLNSISAAGLLSYLLPRPQLVSVMSVVTKVYENSPEIEI